MLISAYSTRLEFVPHDFTPVDGHFRWHESGEQDAGFAASLSELEDYVSRAGVGQPAETVRLLIGHVRDTQRSYSFTLDGADPAQLARLTAWATEANAILVAEGALLDPAGRPLLAGAHGAPTGKVPLTPESTERAQTIRSWLASAHGLQIPGDLPPVRSAAETRTRDVSDVGLRIIGLVMTSDFASSVIAGSPLNQRAMQAVFPHAMAALPPTERELFNRRETGAARKLQRRIEAANELLWAAGRTTLGWPTTDCHPTQVKDLVLRRGEQGAAARNQRTTGRIRVPFLADVGAEQPGGAASARLFGRRSTHRRAATYRPGMVAQAATRLGRRAGLMPPTGTDQPT